ncbi:DUF3299 domain-containing protein [Hyphomicrobium sp. 1Nfss2.1]|uniref:DUF3299 domain-containing protein n=1 Tax=Hyphomicrobium sp. 1Nfss2.1 TaxID=3413936 RepID=UPI003C7C49E8
MRKAYCGIGVALFAVQGVLSPVLAADAPIDITWAKLMPPAQQMNALKPKTFFAGSQPAPDDGGAPPPPLAEGGFMSVKRKQPGGNQPPRVVTEYNGKRVKIGGYVVPLDFEATSVKEFLLVPFVGACIHVPPPPANQIVYVKSEKGFEIGGQFDPVWVTGTIKTEPAFTGLADAGYTIDADAVEHRKE